MPSLFRVARDYLSRHTLTAMAPVKKQAKVLKIHVPRHNAQRIGNKLNAQVKNLAKQEAVLVDTYQTNPDLAAAAVRITFHSLMGC